MEAHLIRQFSHRHAGVDSSDETPLLPNDHNALLWQPSLTAYFVAVILIPTPPPNEPLLNQCSSSLRSPQFFPLRPESVDWRNLSDGGGPRGYRQLVCSRAQPPAVTPITPAPPPPPPSSRRHRHTPLPTPTPPRPASCDCRDDREEEGIIESLLIGEVISERRSSYESNEIRSCVTFNYFGGEIGSRFGNILKEKVSVDFVFV